MIKATAMTSDGPLLIFGLWHDTPLGEAAQ